jgi:hypothetical protein
MRSTPALALTAILALGATGPAQSAATGSSYVFVVQFDRPVEGRARVIAPPDFEAQARAGTLRQLELEVGPGALRDALAQAKAGGRPFDLTARPAPASAMRWTLKECMISSYQMGAGVVRAGLRIQSAATTAKSELLTATTATQPCLCGETIQGGRVTCHACPQGGPTARATGGARQGPTGAGSLAARIGTAEAAHCCASCPSTGSGSGCSSAGGVNSCLPSQCFLDCACGETTQGGEVTCHAC